jgi:hypothetical protein
MGGEGVSNRHSGKHAIIWYRKTDKGEQQKAVGERMCLRSSSSSRYVDCVVCARVFSERIRRKSLELTRSLYDRYRRSSTQQAVSAPRRPPKSSKDNDDCECSSFVRFFSMAIGI